MKCPTVARLGALSALFWAACSNGPAQLEEGALQASESARSHGVYAYRVTDASTVALLGADGSALGRLHIAEPTADTRLVEIAYTDGRSYSNEVTQPVDGAFRAPLMAKTAEELIQLDPVLAPTFAAHQISFGTFEGPAEIGLSSLYGCEDITFTAGCGKVDHLCSLQNFGSGSSGGVNATAFAACTRSSCSYTYIQAYNVQGTAYDGVAKQRSCFNNGSCASQMALGYYGCMACPFGNDWASDYCNFEY